VSSLHFRTALLSPESGDDPLKASAVPLYQTATFEQPGADQFGPYDYTRSGNPTRAALQGQIARLEGAGHAFAFASGMAALRALLRSVERGKAVVAGEDLYGGTYRLLVDLESDGLDVRYVDTTRNAAVERVVDDRVGLVLVESPTNPKMRVSDLRWLASVAHGSGARLAVDASLMSPYLMRPLSLGADVVVHSATKHIGGHGDVMAGLVVTDDPELARRLAFIQNAEGAGLSPFDAWLLLRGLKTLAVRLDRQQSTAQRLAEFLADHSAIEQVLFPGLPTHPGHDLHASQAKGPGSVLSVLPRRPEMSPRLVEATRLFRIGVSFGSVTSLISLPCAMSHASIPAAVRAARQLPEHLVRLSVGLEEADDLIEDLGTALSFATEGHAFQKTPSLQPSPPQGERES